MYRRMRDLREDSDLTQKELAYMIGVSQRSYSRYETGDEETPTWVLIKLAKIYNVSVDYILGISNEQ